MPAEIKKTHIIETYIEPFVGGGAVFFYLKSYYKIQKAYLFDINRELILTYKVIQHNPDEIIKLLKEYEKFYLNKSEIERKIFFYEIRTKYNQQMYNFDYEDYHNTWIQRAAYVIFLNKTCFNGLFRQNKKGEFNVPFGKYKNPNICNADRILEANKALQNTIIYCADFSISEKFVKEKTLVYLDPPYRPITKTSSFTSYSKEDFNDEDQRRLSDYFNILDKRGAYLILSNSDPKNKNLDDNFFDDLYEDYNIERILAARAINCVGTKRGKINELIITNYKIFIRR